MRALKSPTHRRLRIGISGSYGGMNLGYEAIFEGILGGIRATVDAEITVFSMNPVDTLARHAVEHAMDARTMTRREVAPVIGGLDLLILGGGGILYDGEAEVFLREVNVAHELGVPVFLYAVSAGPLISDASRRAVEQALNAAPATIISVRDQLGRRLLDDVGVTDGVHLTADPAFLLKPQALPIEALKAEGVDFSRTLVGFSVREPGPSAPDIDPEEYHSLLANAADFIIERYNADVLFVPMEIDVRHSHAVVAHMHNAERAEILRRRYSALEILDLMGRFEFVVGMRLHFLIFAALRGVPFAPLPYASKLSGLLEDLQMPSRPLSALSIGQLIGSIDHQWDTREAVRAQIRRNLPRLKRRAAASNELLLKLLSLGDAKDRVEPQPATKARGLLRPAPQSPGPSEPLSAAE